ncbi:sulfate ABC transporter substrate-binding protein [Sphingomonas sp.]|uniref:sulfate ABC transporter substrate-binding protein n=1 Tax=Sphingomonas sp. TaxID=28214 RepID=UPI00286D0207|nr:sulfate ABC transporter substrate-binding protein [Sphingomonas sp.]
MRKRPVALIAGALLTSVMLLGGCARQDSGSEHKLLNVSYDPTRELYKEINPAFAAAWKKDHKQDLTFEMSHGGSGKQSRAVIDGLGADVVTLALAGDIDAIAAKSGKLPADWQARLRDNSAPYTSTIVFLVRKGNPKAIRDWGDLVKPGIEVITPNPKSSGGARWNVLAAAAWARKAKRGDAGADAFLGQLFDHVPVLDSGARGATTTFVERGIGDVLIAWENEALLAQKKMGADKVEMVVPSISILAEPPVAVIDANVKKHGTEEAATAYLKFLYTPEAQEIIARNYYRPRDPAVAARHAADFPKVQLATIADFGGWQAAQMRYFADGGLFDAIMAKKAH